MEAVAKLFERNLGLLPNDEVKANFERIVVVAAAECDDGDDVAAKEEWSKAKPDESNAKANYLTPSEPEKADRTESCC